MEAKLLPDGRTRLILPRFEERVVGLSLLEALPGPVKNDFPFRVRIGVSAEEARSLKDEFSIIRNKLFGLPKNMSGKTRQMYLEHRRTEPRKTGTAWDDLPKMEAELLPDGRIAYTLARGELSIFANVIEEMLRKLAPDRSRGSRTEVEARIGTEIEEAEAVRDELRRAHREFSGESPLPG